MTCPSPARRAAERIIGEIDRLRALAAAPGPTWDYYDRAYRREAAEASVVWLSRDKYSAMQWSYRVRDDGCAYLIERRAK